MRKLTRKHAVMMEYVIIAVLIAAAVVVAVIMFGKNVSKEMNVATQSMSDPKGAETSQKAVETGTKSDIQKANAHEKAMHNYDKQSEKAESCMKKLTRKHAVMMEYVIIAVLIAAAVVVAVIMFGKNVSHEMNVATKSMSDAKGAENYQGELKKNAAQDIKKANEHEKAMHNYDK